MEDRKTLQRMMDDLYNLEKEARDLYSEFLETLTDPEEVKILSGIRDDEIRHMEIVLKIQKLIS